VRGDTIAGADHFFGGEEDRLGGRIAAFLDDET
jgi:alpha/beta superfamily hydrolase